MSEPATPCANPSSPASRSSLSTHTDKQVDHSPNPDTLAIVKALMRQLTESAAEQLSPEQATELVRALDLHSHWDALLGDKGQKDNPVGLNARQKAHAAFQSAWREYSAKNPDVQLPEPSQSMPDRLATWCGVLRTVFRRAAGSSRQVMAKVYRLADAIAARRGEGPVERTPVVNWADAVRELGVVISWCDNFAKPLTPLGVLLRARREDAA